MIKSIRKKLDKYLIKALTVSFAVIFAVSGTFAYMTAKDDVSNTFFGTNQGGEVKIGEYFPDDDIFYDPEKDKDSGSKKMEKKIWAYNTTDTDVFVRVKLSAMAKYSYVDDVVATSFDYSHVDDTQPYIEVFFQWVSPTNDTKFRIYLDNTDKWYCDKETGYFYYKDDLEGSDTEKIYSNKTYRYNGSYEKMNLEEECTVALVQSVQLSYLGTAGYEHKITDFSLTAEMDYVSVMENAEGKEYMEGNPGDWLTPSYTYDGDGKEIASIQWGKETEQS